MVFECIKFVVIIKLLYKNLIGWVWLVLILLIIVVVLIIIFGFVLVIKFFILDWFCKLRDFLFVVIIFIFNVESVFISVFLISFLWFVINIFLLFKLKILDIVIFCIWYYIVVFNKFGNIIF